MTSPSAPDRATADPSQIQSVADLGRFLYELRQSAPRADIFLDPMSLRELSAATGIPKSTLSNAESGRILPRAEVVYRVAVACGVPPEHIPAWVQARNRAARFSRAARAVPDSPRALAQALRAANDPALPEQWQWTDPPSAAVQLSKLPVDAAGACLAGFTAPFAAQCLAELEPGFAAACLAAVPAALVPEILALADAEVKRAFLRSQPATVVTAYLTQMSPQAAAAMLDELPIGETVPLLTGLAEESACEVLPHLSERTKAAVIDVENLPYSLTETLVLDRGPGRLKQLLLAPTTSPRRAAQLLLATPGDPAAEALAALPARRRLHILSQMTELDRVRILNDAPEDVGAGLIEGLPPELSAEMLGELDESRAARIVGEARPPIRTAVLSAMPPEKARLIRRLAAIRRAPAIPA